MKKVIIIILCLFIYYGTTQLVKSQGSTNVTYDDSPVSDSEKATIVNSAKAFAYLLVNIGLMIAAAPTAKRLFRGEPGAYKGVLVWCGGIITANLVIELVLSTFWK